MVMIDVCAHTLLEILGTYFTGSSLLRVHGIILFESDSIRFLYVFITLALPTCHFVALFYQYQLTLGKLLHAERSFARAAWILDEKQVEEYDPCYTQRQIGEMVLPLLVKLCSGKIL